MKDINRINHYAISIDMLEGENKTPWESTRKK